MMVMVSGVDLLTIYLGTELMSLSLYVMTGLKRSVASFAGGLGQILRPGRLFFRASVCTASLCSTA